MSGKEMSRAQRAAELFQEGYNCAQAVFGAFVPDTGMEWETAMLLTSSMGGGVGRLREICGAVSGMALAAGLLWGYSEPVTPASPQAKEAKADHYALIQRLSREFAAENRSIICRDLLDGTATTPGSTPEERTAGYYKTRPCGELVASAAGILERELLARNGQTR